LKTHTFVPKIGVIAKISGVYSDEEIIRERIASNATPDLVRSKCGPLVAKILDQIPGQYYESARRVGLYPICDIRIEKLYAEDEPRGSGRMWHWDGDYERGHPSALDLDANPRPIIATTLSTSEWGVSCTEFLKDPFTACIDDVIPEVTTGFPLHAEIGPLPSSIQVMQQLNATKCHVVSFRDGELLQFDSHTLHHAAEAKCTGRRLFFRMSLCRKPVDYDIRRLWDSEKDFAHEK
jgi:hypothetical protein